MSTTQPYATMSDALRDWLQRHVTEGFEAESLVASMVQSGYDRAFARRVVDEALTGRAPAPVVAPARESAYAQRQRLLKEGRPAPFDAEAT